MRVALRFAYDGRFPGYARQPEGDTVEDMLMSALSHEGLVSDSWRTGSRTDRGVAALANVAACELERPHLEGIVPATQRHLPEGIWITGVAPVDSGFDPRKAAWREYAYHAPARDEDAHAMGAACQAFVGRHDVSAFARVETHRDPVRTVLSMGAERDGDWWVFHVRGQSFLWNQVRRMVDAVLAVGRGTARVADIQQALESGRKPAAFGIAAPEGLVLAAVHYEQALDWQGGRLPDRGVLAYGQRARIEDALADSLGRHV